MNFTKGPWIIQPEKIQTDCEMSDMIVGPIEGTQVCQVYVDEEHEVANAHLISAAPELLICCEASLVYLKLQNHLSKDHLILELEKVIKKARGET